jgi:hypothetical protein
MQKIVQLFVLIYNSLHPVYGYGLLTPNSYERRGEKELAIVVAGVYDYNFFGPDIVEQMGKDVIVTVPSWETVFFADGGMLLQMSPNPADPRINMDFEANYQEAAKIIGVEKFLQGG